MREPTRIVISFGALGIGTLAFMLLASLAAAQTTHIYTGNTGSSATARVTTGTDQEVIVIAPARTTTADPYVRESALRANVASRLAGSRSLAGSNILVTSHNGSIVLNGTVAETEDIARAEMIARRTPGVAAVITQLTVDPVVIARLEAAERLSDQELARRVAMRLASEFGNADVDQEWDYGYEVEGVDLELDVRVDDGEVTLSGEVPSYDTLGRAIAIARSEPGVVAVRANPQLDVEEASSKYESYPGPFEKPEHHPFFGRSRDYDD